MNGLLLPHFDVLRSAHMPTIGCTISPESGPATQTAEVVDFFKPNCNRYGVAYVISRPQVSLQHSLVPRWVQKATLDLL